MLARHCHRAPVHVREARETLRGARHRVDGAARLGEREVDEDACGYRGGETLEPAGEKAFKEEGVC